MLEVVLAINLNPIKNSQSFIPITYFVTELSQKDWRGWHHPPFGLHGLMQENWHPHQLTWTASTKASFRSDNEFDKKKRPGISRRHEAWRVEGIIKIG